MAQRVLGIDLGAHSVKVAKVDVGFHSAQLINLQTLRVPSGPGLPLERSLQTLSDMDQLTVPFDAAYVGIPGDRVLLRLLHIPFTEAKKIGAVVGNELADNLPWELEDVVFDHMPLPASMGQVLAVAAKSAEIKSFLEALSTLNLDPRGLPVAPLCYAGLARRIEPTGTVLVVDLGHLRTNACFVQNGRVLVARTLSRAGHQITESFRQMFQLSYSEAEALKEKEALLISGGPDLARPNERAFASSTTQGVLPIVRELRLTLGLFSSKLGVRPERILLCGGTSRIRGLDSYFTAELGVPTERLRLDVAQDLDADVLDEAEQAAAALSLGLALEQGARQRIDLRQGQFSYQHDTSIFKDKIVAIAVSVVLVLICAALNAYMSLYALHKEEIHLALQLKRATQMVFGEAVENPVTISRRVKLGARAISSGVPQKTALDIFMFLSTAVPPSNKVKLDITRLEIKQGKTYLTGTAESRSAVGDIVKAIEKNKCFSNIATGTISDVAEGKKQFSLTITTECF